MAYIEAIGGIEQKSVGISTYTCVDSKKKATLSVPFSFKKGGLSGRERSKPSLTYSCTNYTLTNRGADVIMTLIGVIAP
jgi:hypothetical protein